jgi:hypothetical protein
MKRIATLLVVCCLGLMFAASTCFAQMYIVTDLGTLGGTVSVAWGINASGQVVGVSAVPYSAATGNGRYDDQADMMTQASAWLLRREIPTVTFSTVHL